MNKRIDLTNNGGFPATQYTLDWMQSSYRNCFIALAALIGDKVIVSGMVTAGINTSAGWITYGGELIPFVAGVTLDHFVIEELNETRLFNDNTTKPVYYTKQAKFSSDGFLFSELKRPSTIINFFNAFTSLVESFNDFVTDTNAAIEDLNSRITTIYRGTIPLSDFAANALVTVVHNQNVAGSNYFVVGTLVSLGANYDQDNDTVWMIRSVTANSFQLCLSEYAPEVQNLRFDYALIKK